LKKLYFSHGYVTVKMTQDVKSKGALISIAALVGASFGAAMASSGLRGGKSKGSTSTECGVLVQSLEALDEEKHKVDAILVLGGGRPIHRSLPPPWVTSRCDIAAQAHNMLDKTPILTLSAGTAHADQLLNEKGLPVWESEASALYMISKHQIAVGNIFMETSSYDTIGNAYFARTSFCEVFGWKRLLVITSEFHMPRTRAIFDWMFNIPNREGGENPGYRLLYLQSPNSGLSEEIVAARIEREEIGRKRVATQQRKYNTLPKALKFLTTEHGMYKVPSEYLSRFSPRETNSTATASSGHSVESDISGLIKQSYAVVLNEEDYESTERDDNDANPPNDDSAPVTPRNQIPTPMDNHFTSSAKA